MGLVFPAPRMLLLVIWGKLFASRKDTSIRLAISVWRVMVPVQNALLILVLVSFVRIQLGCKNWITQRPVLVVGKGTAQVAWSVLRVLRGFAKPAFLGISSILR